MRTAAAARGALGTPGAPLAVAARVACLEVAP